MVLVLQGPCPSFYALVDTAKLHTGTFPIAFSGGYVPRLRNFRLECHSPFPTFLLSGQGPCQAPTLSI